MRIVVLATGALCFLVLPSVGQETVVREARCWVGSSTFSAGSAMGVNGSVAVCDAAAGWVSGDADISAAGCLLEGELSSVGAVVGIRNNDGMMLQCDASGLWITLQRESAS